MDILDSLLNEDEVLEMSPECLTAFIKVLDIKYLRDIALYIKDSNNSEVTDKLLKYGEVYLAPMIIYNEVKELPSMFTMRVPTLVKEITSGEIDVHSYSKALDTVLKFKDSMVGVIPGRSAEMYQSALLEMDKYEAVSKKRVHDISSYMRSLKSMFYPGKKEPSRNTGLSGYIKKMSDFEMQKASLDFVTKCIEKNIYGTGGVKL